MYVLLFLMSIISCWVFVNWGPQIYDKIPSGKCALAVVVNLCFFTVLGSTKNTTSYYRQAVLWHSRLFRTDICLSNFVWLERLLCRSSANDDWRFANRKNHTRNRFLKQFTLLWILCVEWLSRISSKWFLVLQVARFGRFGRRCFLHSDVVLRLLRLCGAGGVSRVSLLSARAARRLRAQLDRRLAREVERRRGEHHLVPSVGRLGNHSLATLGKCKCLLFYHTHTHISPRLRWLWRCMFCSPTRKAARSMPCSSRSHCWLRSSSHASPFIQRFKYRICWRNRKKIIIVLIRNVHLDLVCCNQQWFQFTWTIWFGVQLWG